MKRYDHASVTEKPPANAFANELRVAFDFDDALYIAGMWPILQDIFTTGMGIPLLRLPSAPAYSVLPQADIYIGRFPAGAEVICRPEFLLRNPRGLLVMVSEGMNPPGAGRMSDCLQNRVVLRKQDSLANVHRKIAEGWENVSGSCPADCDSCCAVHLSGDEQRITTWLCQSIPVVQVARKLHIHPKRVSAYKRAAMKKLNVSTNAELMEFMSHWKANVTL